MSSTPIFDQAKIVTAELQILHDMHLKQGNHVDHAWDQTSAIILGAVLEINCKKNKRLRLFNLKNYIFKMQIDGVGLSEKQTNKKEGDES
jgi:hypothetical protein